MEHPPETRAAVLAAVASGQSVNSVAKQYGVSRSTARMWKTQAQLPSAAMVSQQKKEAIGEQVYGLLEESIAALRFQLRTTQDEEWIKRQSADNLAVFYGVLADKSIRLLAAFRPASSSDPAIVDATPEPDTA